MGFSMVIKILRQTYEIHIVLSDRPADKFLFDLFTICESYSFRMFSNSLNIDISRNANYNYLLDTMIAD